MFWLTFYFSQFVNTVSLYIQQVLFLTKKEIPSRKCLHLNVRFWGAYGVTDAKFPV